MDDYEIIVTPDAEDDLNELDDYITYVLLAPDTALAYIRDIRKKIVTLRNCREIICTDNAG